jgi:hypothetical protein
MSNATKDELWAACIDAVEAIEQSIEIMDDLTAAIRETGDVRSGLAAIRAKETFCDGPVLRRLRRVIQTYEREEGRGSENSN